jgi:hypothetical protein
LNKAIILLSIFLGGVALKDLLIFTNMISSFEDVNGININFEVGYYIFGSLFFLLAKISDSDGVKYLANSVSILCLLVMAYSIIDFEKDTVGAARECIKITDENEKGSCIDKLLKKK